MAGPPGWAYLRTRGDIAAIDPSGKVRTIKVKNGYLTALRRGSDGNAYALAQVSSAIEVSILEGGALRTIATNPNCGLSRDAFDVRGDRVAINCHEGLMERTGAGAFTPAPVPDTGAYEQAVWIANGGALHYASNNGLWVREGNGWKQITVQPGALASNPKLVDAPDGAHLLTGSTILRVEGLEAKLVRENKTRGERWVDPASNGLFGFWSETSGLALHTVAGEWKHVPTKAWLSRAHLDDSGRTWAVVDGQLQIGATTGEVTTVAMGSYPELGELSIVSEPIVVGSGPQPPAERPVRRTKRITGKITVDGQPLADADIELCPRSQWMFSGGTPCGGADKHVFFATKTDAKGVFSVDDAPMGLYYVHYKAKDADKWSIDSTALENLRENAVTNLGTIAYAKP